MTDSFFTKTGSTDFTRKYDPKYRSQRYKANREKAEREHKSHLVAKAECPKPFVFPVELDAAINNLDENASSSAPRTTPIQKPKLISDPVPINKKSRPRAARPKSYLNDVLDEDINRLVVHDSDPNYNSETFLQNEGRGRNSRRSENRNDELSRGRRKERSEVTEEFSHREMKVANKRKNKPMHDGRKDIGKNNIQEPLFYKRRNTDQKIKPKEELKDENFDYYQSVYNNQRRIMLGRKESVEEDVAFVDEFMKQEEEERIHKERKIAEDTTRGIVQARDELADLEALLTEELYAPIPPPTPAKDKTVKEHTNNKKIRRKRSSDHQKINEAEVHKENTRNNNVDVSKAHVDTVNSEDGLATLVGKVRNSKVNEEMRAIIAAARDSNKAELEAEKMESARIHELLENARNQAKGNRPERRLSVPSEPSVDNSHFGTDHKKKDPAFPTNFAPAITRSEEVFDEVRTTNTSSASSCQEQKQSSFGHLLQRKLSFPYQPFYQFQKKRPGALTPIFHGLPTTVKSLLDSMQKEKVHISQLMQIWSSQTRQLEIDMQNHGLEFDGTKDVEAQMLRDIKELKHIMQTRLSCIRDLEKESRHKKAQSVPQKKADPEESLVFASVPMIPRDETEAANWKPQNVPKPPLPAITIPNPTEEERAVPERELPSRSEFVTEQFISNEGVAFFFPKSEANTFTLEPDDVSSKTNMDVSSKTNMATFEESKTDVMFKEVAFRDTERPFSVMSMDCADGRLSRLQVCKVSPSPQPSDDPERRTPYPRIPRSKTAHPSRAHSSRMNHNTMWSSIPPQYTSSGIDRSQMSRASGVIEMTEPSSASVVSHLEREADDVPDDDDIESDDEELRGLDSVPDVLDVQEVPEQVASVYNVSQAGAVLREVPEEIPDMEPRPVALKRASHFIGKAFRKFGNRRYEKE